MSIAAVKELQALFGRFDHAYHRTPEDVDVVLDRVMSVATCLERLRTDGQIGAYLGGMDSIDRFYRDSSESTLMEDPRDPAIMQAIAEYFPIHTLSGLNFFTGSQDEIMQAAIRSYAAHMQVRSAFTLKNDAVSVVREMAKQGLKNSVDDFLILLEEISQHDPMIMGKADFRVTLCCAFEGVMSANAPFSVSPKLHSLVESYLINSRLEFQIAWPNIESAMGLAKCGYPELAGNLATTVFPRCRTLNERQLLGMKALGIDVDPVMQKIALNPSPGWAQAYFAYLLLTPDTHLEIPGLSLADQGNKAAAKLMIQKLHAEEGFNMTNARLLMGEYGRLYPTEGRDFFEIPKLKPLALTVDRYREASIGADLGL
ncbi:hypothetical protein [Pseudomonas viridiflava]|uniref:hypothetical protein n=1 Tax=Pseudomonas viridiflava TaxID=33069 RepID=UPI000F03900D|nr:hypothetical protein [Pseudomonas viridiflava]